MVHDDRTTAIQGWIDRLQHGDDSARAALLTCACDRLTRLSRKMLKSYPGVGRWEQTDDVLQNALVRLDRALASVTPPTAKDFFRLAATQIRRELIDLARRHRGPEGLGANYSTQGATDGPHDPEDPSYDPGRLVAWTEFHQRVEDLPDEDREVFDLLWYQGLTQGEAAGLIGVSERTVARRWVAARMRLGDALDGQFPS